MDDRTAPKNSDWLEDDRYQAVLRTTRTIAFEYDPETQKESVAPIISELLAGNYDGRPLSVVMLNDGVIYPDDIPLSLQFREQVATGGAREMTLRLKTPSGQFRWFRMVMYPFTGGGRHYYVGSLTDVDEEMRQKQLLQYRSQYDPVTGIYNESAFYAATEQVLTGEADLPHFLLRFDIDRFKIVNDLYSVAEGDRVLRYIGDTLRSLARPNETFGRLGGDVFGLCLSRTKPQTLSLLGELEKRVSAYPLNFQFVLSTGIVPIPRYDGQRINVLCDWAAMAQHTVKGNVLHRFAFYDNRLRDTLNREHQITIDMNRGLEEGQFLMFLQPKFDIRTHSVIGAEALARWNHPEEGMIPPGEFIPLFERNGFILCLDEYIWEEACKVLRKWLDEGLAVVPISVNVSRIHMYDPNFCQKIQALTEKYDLPPRLLELEITESAYTESPEELYAIMERLQHFGFVFSMDDFGSGYSSLNVLKDIPVNTIKIDLNFLGDGRRGKEVGRNVLRGTIQLVRNMNLPIVAEGVETQEQAEFLLSVGCTRGQGYYFAKPMSTSDFAKLLPQCCGLASAGNGLKEVQ